MDLFANNWLSRGTSKLVALAVAAVLTGGIFSSNAFAGGGKGLPAFAPGKVLHVAGCDRKLAANCQLTRTRKDHATNSFVNATGMAALSDEHLIAISTCGRGEDLNDWEGELQHYWWDAEDKIWRIRKLSTNLELRRAGDIVAETDGSFLFNTAAGIVRVRFSEPSRGLEMLSQQTVLSEEEGQAMGLPSLSDPFSMTASEGYLYLGFPERSKLYRVPLDQTRRSKADVEDVHVGNKGDDPKIDAGDLAADTDGSIFLAEPSERDILRRTVDGQMTQFVSKEMWPDKRFVPEFLEIVGDELMVVGEVRKLSVVMAVSLKDPTRVRHVVGATESSFRLLPEHDVDALAAELRDINSLRSMPNGDLLLGGRNRAGAGRVKIVENRSVAKTGPYSQRKEPAAFPLSAPVSKAVKQRSKAQEEAEVDKAMAELGLGPKKEKSAAKKKQAPAAVKKSKPAKPVTASANPALAPSAPEPATADAPQEAILSEIPDSWLDLVPEPTKKSAVSPKAAKKKKKKPRPPKPKSEEPLQFEEDDAGGDWNVVSSVKRTHSDDEETRVQDETSDRSLSPPERDRLFARLDRFRDQFDAGDETHGSFVHSWNVHRGKHAYEDASEEINLLLADPGNGTQKVLNRAAGRTAINRSAVKRLARWLLFEGGRNEPSVKVAWYKKQHGCVSIEIPDVRALTQSRARWSALGKAGVALERTQGRTGITTDWDGRLAYHYGLRVGLAWNGDMLAVTTCFAGGPWTTEVLPFKAPAASSKAPRLRPDQVRADHQLDSAEESSGSTEPSPRTSTSSTSSTTPNSPAEESPPKKVLNPKASTFVPRNGLVSPHGLLQ